MVYETIHKKIEKYNKECTIYVLSKETATKYDTFWVTDDLKIGAFFNNSDKTIGILTFTEGDIYSPTKLIEKTSLAPAQDINEKDSLLKCWNEEIITTPTPEHNCDAQESQTLDWYDDVELTEDELAKYFIRTVQTYEPDKKINFHDTNAKWTTYYLNPPCGVSIKINKTRFSYSSQKIKQITIYEDEHTKTIYCYDYNDKWVEDVDIVTKEPLDNIRFIFEKGDLKSCSTVNLEQQAYVKLYEELNPYNPVEENREIILKFIKKYEQLQEFARIKNMMELEDSDGPDKGKDI